MGVNEDRLKYFLVELKQGKAKINKNTQYLVDNGLSLGYIERVEGVIRLTEKGEFFIKDI